MLAMVSLKSMAATASRVYTARLHPKQPAVLIVDDYDDGREALAAYLAGCCTFRVLAARDAAEALVLAREYLPAIILMDLAMVDLDGWEATRRLKVDPRTKHIIVIAVSACAFGPDEAMARDAGCEGFVVKPFDVARLAEALERVIEHGRSALPAIDVISPGEVSI
jgi:two-component system cell cycle response regulator DivK